MYQKIRSGGPGGRSCCDFTQQTSLLIPIPIKLQWFWPSLQVLSAIRVYAGRAGQTLEVHWSAPRANAPETLVKNPRERTTLVKINLKSGGRPRRCRRALQCRYRAPSMSTPGQRWSDRQRLGSSMMTDIGGAAPTTTSHSSFLRPMSHHKQHCSCGQLLRLILTRVGRAECLRGRLSPPPQRRRLGRHASDL